MANVNTTVTRIYQATASDSSGTKIGYISGETKAAQNDTVTLTNVTEIVAVVGLVVDATGTAETFTKATNVITATSATGSATLSGMVIYR